MRLVADRFLTHDSANPVVAIDLATRQPVWLEVQSAGDVEEQRRWSVRCGDLFQLRHPSLATLIDYGLLGSNRRFEAWSGHARAEGTRAPDETTRTAAAFLHAIGLTANSATMVQLVGHAGPCVRPGPEDGYARPAAVAPWAEPCDVPGLQLVARPSISAIAEMLHADAAQRPRVAVLWGAAGSGMMTAVHVLAREARIRGFVPIDSSMLAREMLEALSGRTLLMIGRAPVSASMQHLLTVSSRSPRSHVLLLIQRSEVPGVDGLDIGRVDRDALVAAVRPWSDAIARAATNAAETARGLPGVFARLLWESAGVRPMAATRRSRVAEHAVVYGDDAGAPDGQEAPVGGRESAGSWPAAADIAALRRRLAHAAELVAAGRHAPGLRLKRQCVGALARRQAWSDAAAAGVALAGDLLVRGGTREAVRVLETARDHAARAADAAVLSDAALLIGHAWIDLARLGDAESLLRAALAAARTSPDPSRVRRCAWTLCRCLLWQAAHGEAAALLSNVAVDSMSDPERLTHHRLVARLAGAEGEASRALAAADEAMRVAEQGDAADQSAALYTSALVRLLVGDLGAVDRPAARCVAAARAARRPMRLFAALVLQAEADRRRQIAIAPVRRRMLERMARTATPLLRLRFELVKAAGDARDAAAAASMLATSSGVRALTTLVPGRGRGGAHGDLDPLIREIVEIVRVCHDADEEQSVLRQVCAQLRQQLHAASVAFLVSGGGTVDVIASDGPRIDPEIAERVLSTGMPAPPCRIRDRLEAGAPVQYGGVPIAALCARWTPGAADELARAAAVLSVAASAAAPAVHAVRLRREARPTGGPELIGTTLAVSELRRAIERAAAAPFPVLIEGESGSGKELVARGIHRASQRRDRPFATLNCAALPDDLVESELFGHARGAFTGATADRPGVFEEAHGGTIFLDEVGELSPRAQAKVLRVIQEGELRRIGENLCRRIDARIVCATNRDLRREAAAGRFRLDLVYRLDVIRIVVPPLRDRREDVVALLDHFWADATRRVGSRATLGASTRTILASYDWPGNVRELQNVLAALAVRSPRRGVVPPHALPPHIATARRPEVWRLDAARRTFEEAFVRAALVRTGGHRIRAAAELGLTRQGLNKLMTRLGIE